MDDATAIPPQKIASPGEVVSVELLELPHTAGCLVCGPDNPHAIGISSFVNSSTGTVMTQFTPRPHHIGFDDIVHGGVLAMVLDEIMVWAATWRVRRFCVCGELVTRFRHSAPPGAALRCEALVDFSRPRLVETSSKVFDASNRLIATGNGKYVPVSFEAHQRFVQTFHKEPATEAAATYIAQTHGTI